MTYEINFKRRSRIEISDALHTLCPGSTWSVGDTYESIKNFKSDEYQLPSEEEINAEISRLQEIVDGYEYQRQRAPEYPDIKDQLDAIWKGGDAYNEMLAKVMAVKDKYPKPGE